MSSWENEYEGYVLDSKTVEKTIEDYDQNTCSNFIVLKKDKLFGSSLEGEWVSRHDNNKREPHVSIDTFHEREIDKKEEIISTFNVA